MPQETEIKLHIKDKRVLLRSLKRLGARAAGHGKGRIHEWNVIYDTPQGGLAKHGQLLRIRTETSEDGRRETRKARQRTVLTFKQPVPGGGQGGGFERAIGAAGKHKVREELEVEIADAEALGKIFEGLGMRGWFRYEKYRTTMKLPAARNWARDLLIEVDETPIGTYAELEGPPEAIDRMAEALGFQQNEYILKSYLALYLEHCRKRGEEPRDMIFDRR